MVLKKAIAQSNRLSFFEESADGVAGLDPGPRSAMRTLGIGWKKTLIRSI